VFGDGATILPVIGKFMPEWGKRTDAQYYADLVIQQMKILEFWKHNSERARALAEKHTWSRVIDNWEAMMTSLVEVPVA
jgi:predicted dehydrogenase